MSISLGSAPDRGGFAGIAQAVRADVLRGPLRPGTQLPSINEMAQRHNTTAVTVRRALRELEDEGLIRVEHGVGTFVADWGRQFDLLHLPSFSREMAGRVETRLVARALGTASREAARALGVPDGPVHVLTRLRLLDGVPVVFQRSYVADALRGVIQAYEPSQSLYEMLFESVGRAPLAADEVLEPVTLYGEAAATLREQAGAFGWRSRRTTFDAAGEPLVYDDASFAAERMRVRITRRAGQTGVAYEANEE